jgi:CheY-like chemotaxis protein
MSATILVVEDDKDIRKNMNRLLKSEGYFVVLAENGQVALDYLNGAAILPQLIILDLMMPIMDGFQFRTIQQADSRFADIPVIIATADGHPDEKRMRTGARDAIRKPADIETILRAVKQVC